MPAEKKQSDAEQIEQLNMLAIDNSTRQSATEELIGRRPTSLADEIGYIRR